MFSGIFTQFWVLFTLVCLIFGSYFDWKDRIIPDKIWATQLLGGIGFLIYWYFTANPSNFDVLIVTINILLGFMFTLVLLLFAAMGGGDIKAFFSISISYPLVLNIFEDPVFPVEEIFPALFGIILNFFLLYVLLALSFFFYNLVNLVRDRTFSDTTGSILEKTRLMFEGIRVKTENISERKFYNPAEILDEDIWRLHTPTINGLLTDEEFEEIEKEEREQMIRDINLTDKEYIWIRPQIPGIPVLLLAFLMAITIGFPLGDFILSLTWIS